VGEHTFVPAAPGPPLAVLWAQAVERHFTNFLNAPRVHVVYPNVPITKRRSVVDIGELPDRFHRPVSVFRHWDLSPH
jgi:hypothetical protein